MSAPDLRFTVGSEPEEDDLVADLYCDDVEWGVIRRREGVYELELEPSEAGAWVLPPAEAADLILRALARLRELERPSP